MTLDDKASEVEQLFLAQALELQRRRAAAVPESRPGVCANCGEQCLPLAVYCDEECRLDHQRRQCVHARTRIPLG